MTQTCADCRYCFDGSECRRNPPRAVYHVDLVTYDNCPDLACAQAVTGYATWPLVSEHDWCGEWALYVGDEEGAEQPLPGPLAAELGTDDIGEAVAAIRRLREMVCRLEDEMP